MCFFCLGNTTIISQELPRLRTITPHVHRAILVSRRMFLAWIRNECCLSTFSFPVCRLPADRRKERTPFRVSSPLIFWLTAHALFKARQRALKSLGKLFAASANEQRGGRILASLLDPWKFLSKRTILLIKSRYSRCVFNVISIDYKCSASYRSDISGLAPGWHMHKLCFRM